MTNEVILIGSDSIGSPDQKLGHILLGNFLRILSEREDFPRYIILWNAGVKIAAADSDILPYLQKLAERGVDIISCRTCVDYFGLAENMSAGVIDGMARIEEILMQHQVLTV